MTAQHDKSNTQNANKIQGLHVLAKPIGPVCDIQ